MADTQRWRDRAIAEVTYGRSTEKTYTHSADEKFGLVAGARAACAVWQAEVRATLFSDEPRTGATIVYSAHSLAHETLVREKFYAALGAIHLEIADSALRHYFARAFSFKCETDDGGAVAGLLKKIDQFSGGNYQSSYGTPPNRWAIDQAKSIVRALGISFLPTRIVPMADGGIGLVLPVKATKSARVSITNDREIVLTLDDGRDPGYWDVDPNEVLSRVETFFRR